MDRILTDLKRVGYTISEAKSQFYMSKFRVVGFIYDALKRHPDISKIIKIVEWLFPNDITEIKVFVRMAIYYKIFIKNFALIAALIYSLIRKRIRFA
jgi:hypothetical protein